MDYGLRKKAAKAAYLAAASAAFFFVAAIPAEAQAPRPQPQPQTGYDKAWFVSPFWSGEYPSGFAVIDKKVVVQGRAKLDKNAPRSVNCELPYLAVIHPWNEARRKKDKVEFWSATKIVPLTAKENFEFSPDPKIKIPIKKGNVIEYVRNSAEGMFQVRIAGKVYDAEQDLFDYMESVPQENFTEEEEWVLLTCVQGQRVFVLYPDDLSDAKSPEKLQAGLLEYGKLNLDGPYGQRKDLTEAEAEKARTSQ